MVSTIEYCLHNVEGAMRERLVTAESDAEIVERRCLQRCGTCYCENFVVVDGAVETGHSHSAMLTDYGIVAQEDR